VEEVRRVRLGLRKVGRDIYVLGANCDAPAPPEANADTAAATFKRQPRVVTAPIPLQHSRCLL
jgi:hypothetical protein